VTYEQAVELKAFRDLRAQEAQATKERLELADRVIRELAAENVAKDRQIEALQARVTEAEAKVEAMAPRLDAVEAKATKEPV